jgi:hypothetical protein
VKALTHKTITTTNRSGDVVEKSILVPLVPKKPIKDNPTASSSSSNLPNDNNIGQEPDQNMEGLFFSDNEGGEFLNPNLNKSKVSVN